MASIEAIPAASIPLDFRKPGIGKTFIEELKKIADSNPDQFLTELEKQSQDSETQRFFETEVKRLAQTVLETRDRFEIVRSGLEAFDKGDHHHIKPDGSSAGDLLPKLVPKWDAFREDFERLIEDSLEASASGADIAKEYASRVLQQVLEPDVDDRALLADIMGYLKDLNVAEENTGTITKDFDSLRLDIGIFKADMAIGMGDAIDNVSQKLREVDKQLSDSKDSFEEKVKDVTTGISSWFKTWHVERTTMHTPEGMLPAPEILALIPARALAGILRVSARDTLVGGTISWDSGFSSSSEIHNWSNLETQHQQLVDDDFGLYTLQLEFKRREKDIEAATEKMAVMTRFWKIFDKDAKDLHDLIAAIPGVRTSSGMIRHIRLLRSTYYLVAHSLNAYFEELRHVA